MILVAGILLVGQTVSFSDVPRFCYVLPSLAPLALWAVSTGRLSKLKGAKGAVVKIGLPLAVAGIAVVVAAVLDFRAAGE